MIYTILLDCILENDQHTNKNHTDSTKAKFVLNARIKANFASSNAGFMPCWLCNEPFCRILRKFCKLYIAEFNGVQSIKES